MSCEASIDIRAKGSGRDVVVSLRQNELIRNLRALVAVRFEQAIDRIVLVFAGQVLRDVGTIDSHGIISGVTVHVVCRPDLSGCETRAPNLDARSPPTNLGEMLKSRIASHVANLLAEPDLLRSLLQSDPRIRVLLEENVMLRHYLSSDRNLREVLSLAFSPAKQEMSRRRDLYILRMESVPGGYKLLGRLNCCMRQTYENNVALTFQQPSNINQEKTNSQQGRENNEPLPNPWQRPAAVADLERSLRLRQNEGQGSSTSCSKNASKPLAEGGVASGQKAKSDDSRDQGYGSQLERLVQMGYTNRDRNIYALRISLGNVDSAVRLLDHWNRSISE
ncbi:hypothetical protein KR009_004773 [Drosophila setifemur]|nr:hypothetical protein KR009_004773 [Drosophila setifemur]